MPSAAVSLPESYAAALRTGAPPVVGRIEDGPLPAGPAHGRARRTTTALAAVSAVRRMFVVATAGHVDHGKSTLVQRLTGMWPDRLAEEQRRGLTIDLGFAWTEIDGRQFAFVDVPGHERFVANMLAGVGPVPAVMFVVAATEGWMPQSEEHLAALQALGVRHVLVVISKADLDDPSIAIEQVRAADRRCAGRGRYRSESGSRSNWFHWSTRLPPPDRDADVRLWVDRSFSVRGAGTVVTGTLAAGTIRVGDELEHAGRRVTVRGLQSLGRDRTEVGAVARVAVNLRGIDRQHIGRGDAVRTPGAWLDTEEIDVALRAAGEAAPRNWCCTSVRLAVPVHVRPLGASARGCGWRVRCRCASGTSGCCGTRASTGSPPGSRCSTCVRRSCVAAAPHAPGPTSWRPAASRPPVCTRANELRAMGFAPTGQLVGEWVVDPQWWAERRQQVMTAVQRWVTEHDVAAGMPLETLRRQAGLPAVELVSTLLDGTGLEVADGLVRPAEHGPAVAGRQGGAHPGGVAGRGAVPCAGGRRAERAASSAPKSWRRRCEQGGSPGSPTGVVLGPDALDRAADVLQDAAATVHRQRRPARAGHHPPGRRAVARTT